jgi:hypothetical protein
MAINTKALLKTYILGRLGSPVINVEIADTQLDYVIDKVIQKFSDYAISGQEPKVFVIDTLPDVYQYKLDDRVKALFNVRFRSTGFSFQMPGGLIITPSDFFSQGLLRTGQVDLAQTAAVIAKISMIEKYYDIQPSWDYNDNTKMLTFFEEPHAISNHMLIECALEYEPQAVDMIFDHQWVKEMCVAESLLQWSQNVGKYNAPLINGASINYNDMRVQANADIERLNNELLDRWCAPLGIYRA